MLLGRTELEFPKSFKNNLWIALDVIVEMYAVAAVSLLQVRQRWFGPGDSTWLSPLLRNDGKRLTRHSGPRGLTAGDLREVAIRDDAPNDLKRGKGIREREYALMRCINVITGCNTVARCVYLHAP